MKELTTINRHHRYTSIPEQLKGDFYLDTVQTMPFIPQQPVIDGSAEPASHITMK